MEREEALLDGTTVLMTVAIAAAESLFDVVVLSSEVTILGPVCLIAERFVARTWAVEHLGRR